MVVSEAIRMEPESGSCSPASMRRSVVLPDPFGPERPMRSRFLTCQETSSKRTLSPNRLWRPSTWIMPGRFRNSRQARCSMARCSGSRKLRRYSLMTFTSMSSHSVQQEAQMEARTFSLTAGGKGTRWAGGASPGL